MAQDSILAVDVLRTPDGSKSTRVEDLLSGTTEMSNLNYTLSGAASAVKRTLQSKLDEGPSVRDFGAKGDGVTDDTAAVQAMIDSGMYPIIYFPAGSYLLGSITWNGGNLEFIGESMQNTEIISNISTGTVFTGGTTTKCGSVRFSGFRFLTPLDNAVTAIDVRFDGAAGATEGYRRPQALFTDLIFQGNAPSNGIFGACWAYCIRTRDALIATFTDVSMTGYPIISAAARGIMFECLSEGAGVAVYTFTRCYSLFGQYAVNILSSTDPGLEGVYIDHCNFVFPYVGIRAINSATSTYVPPQLFISNTHCEAIANAVAVVKFDQVSIYDCLLYKVNDATSADPLVYLTNCTNAELHDFYVVMRPLNTNVAGIVLNACTNSRIRDVHGTTMSGQPVVSLTASASGANNKVRDIHQYGAGATVFDSNAAYNQSTEQIAQAAGWQWVGKLKESWGTVAGTTSSSGDLAVTFPEAYTSWVSITATNSNAVAGVQPVTIHTKTLTGFVAHFEGANSAAREVTYHVKGV